MGKSLVKRSFPLLFGGVMMLTPLHAQEAGEWSVGAGADFVSGYWWRGFNLADGSVQPSVSVDYEKGDWSLSFGLWATQSLWGDTYKELDLSVEASWKGFTLSVTDYYDCETFAPFNVGHALDVGLSYTLSESIPLTLSWYSIVLGNKADDNLPSYVELSYPFSLSVIDFTAMVGFVPMDSYYYETEHADVTNLGLSAGHEFQLGDWATLPVSVQYNYNPVLDDHFFGGGVGIYF